jgi:hypothetical protein
MRKRRIQNQAKALAYGQHGAGHPPVQKNGKSASVGVICGKLVKPGQTILGQDSGGRAGLAVANRRPSSLVKLCQTLQFKKIFRAQRLGFVYLV